MTTTLLLSIGAVLLVAALLALFHGETVLVRDFEVGLLYRKGRFERELAADRYRVHRSTTSIVRVDLRQRSLTTATQEVPTQDQVAVHISGVAGYRVSNARLLLEATMDWEAELYLALQLALRVAAARFEIDEIQSQRGALSEAFQQALEGEGARLGVEIVRATVKDLRVDGELKKAIGEAARARAESKAKLERVRGETAALRSLANAARLLEQHKGLYELRLLETAGLAAASSDNTLVLGLSEGAMNARKR